MLPYLLVLFNITRLLKYYDFLGIGGVYEVGEKNTLLEAGKNT